MRRDLQKLIQLLLLAQRAPKRALGALVVLVVAALVATTQQTDAAPAARPLSEQETRRIEQNIARTSASSTARRTANNSAPPKIQYLDFLRFSDGDTLKVIYRGDKESLRVIGIDTPETHENERLKKMVKRTGRDKFTIMKLGRRSLAHAQSLLTPGEKIPVEFDVDKRDKYGRLLGYVYLKDGRLFAEEMLASGHAELLTIPPNVKYTERLQAAARSGHSGMR